MNHSWVMVAALATCVVASDAIAAPTCKLDKKKLKRPPTEAIVSLDNAIVAALWDAKRGVVLTNVETGKDHGSPAALPASPAGKVIRFVRTGEGLAAIARLRKSEDEDGGRLFIARFGLDGKPIGEPKEIASSLAKLPMPALDIVAVGTKLVLLEETKLLTKTQVQVIDLDGKSLGKPVDGEAGRFGRVAPAGIDGTTLAILQRDSEGGDERLRMFDVEKNAWRGPATPMKPDYYINGLIPFGKTALLVGNGKNSVSVATVDVDGKLGKWKKLRAFGDTDLIRWAATTPDGTHAQLALEVGKKQIYATLLPNLTLKEHAKRAASSFSSGNPRVTPTTILDPSGDDYFVLHCTK